MSDRRRGLAEVLVLLLVSAFTGAWITVLPSAPVHAATPCADGSLNIVAHTDDDLLFLSPDFMRDLASRRCTMTVFTTAGEAGEGRSYWLSLEAGIRATYAEMAGLANQWTTVDDGVSGRSFLRQQLNGAGVSVAFLRIPDGFPNGSGSDTYNYESILKLWNGTLSQVTPVDGSTPYTKSQMTATLKALMDGFKPSTVRTQDFTGSYTRPYDHSDHWATAKFAEAASKQYLLPHTLTAYDAYVIDEYPQNVFGDELARKIDAFVTFAAYDHNVCNSPGEGCPDSPFDEWLKRQYITAAQWTGEAQKATGTTVAASSQKSAAQGPEKVRDGYPWGAPNDASREWVTAGQTTGAWIEYGFAQSTTIGAINLYDRPVTTDQVTSGTLTLSDGSTVPVGTLPNDGSGLTVRFPAKTTSSVRFTVNSVAPGTTAAGLAEFELLTASDTTAPVVTATPPGGQYDAGTTITLSANETATIYYTTDGSTPTQSSPVYSAPLTLSGPLTLKYFAKDAAGNVSPVQTQTYATDADTTAPIVTVTPLGGQYDAGTTITLSANESATIYYTTDGSTPTQSSPVYSAPLILTVPMTLGYSGKDAAGNVSAAQSQTYTLTPDTTAPIITATPAAGTYPAGTPISLSSDEPATIYYTTDGSTPTQSSQIYSGPLALTAPMTLRYFGKDAAGNVSAAQSQTYALTPPGPPSWHDYGGDGIADLLAADSGTLYLYPGTGMGSLGTRSAMATGWSGMNATLTPGDFDGDAKPDVLARASGDGSLWLYPGNVAGGFGTRRQVGWVWNVMTAVFSPGDFNGDGKSDVLARDGSGNLWLYPGNGTGGFLSRTQVGWGWNIMNAIVSGRDFTGDGKPDVLARDTNGVLWLYPGNGASGWLARSQVATGWSGLSQIAAPADLSGDGKTDVVARDSAGALWLYPGTGTGGIGSRSQLGTGWGTVSGTF